MHTQPSPPCPMPLVRKRTRLDDIAHRQLRRMAIDLAVASSALAIIASLITSM